MEDLLVRYGLPAIFLGAVIDGDIALLVAGVVTHLGMLALLPVLVVGAFGLFVSDILWFLVGRYAGPRLRETALYRRAARGVERLAGRAGPWQIVVARVVYGTRVATMLFWGARGLSAWRFLMLDAAGCIWWATAMVCIGYFLSGSAATLAGRVTAIEHWLLGGLVVAVGVALTRRALSSHRAAG